MGWLFIGSWTCSLPSNGPYQQRLVNPASSPDSGSQMPDLDTFVKAELVVSTFEQDIPTCGPGLPNRVMKRTQRSVFGPLLQSKSLVCASIWIHFSILSSLHASLAQRSLHLHALIPNHIYVVCHLTKTPQVNYPASTRPACNVLPCGCSWRGTVSPR